MAFESSHRDTLCHVGLYLVAVKQCKTSVEKDVAECRRKKKNLEGEGLAPEERAVPPPPELPMLLPGPQPFLQHTLLPSDQNGDGNDSKASHSSGVSALFETRSSKVNMTPSSIPPRLLAPPQREDEEREAFIALDPSGFFIRHPPKPHNLDSYITHDDDLFQTIHMGAAVVDPEKWRLVVTGLAQRSFTLDLETIRSMPRKTIVSFHECFGSPVKPATEALWRVGNVKWTGVPLKHILYLAQPLSTATYVWSEGLDRGEFFGVKADRYQKDLPIAKAMSEEVLLAYEINGQLLSKERGGPLRLIVPGWFGTNSTKWISKIELREHRAAGPYVTTFYNESDPEGPEGALRPVWRVEVNSLISRPIPESTMQGPDVMIEGWAWHEKPVVRVDLSVDEGSQWRATKLESRVDFSWQRFHCEMQLQPGEYTILARATSADGKVQPLKGRRNHCHSVKFTVV